MTIPIPIATEVATELAEREAFLERTRSARIAGAQALLQQCSTPTVQREVSVLQPYVRIDGTRGYWKTPRVRNVPVWL